MKYVLVLLAMLCMASISAQINESDTLRIQHRLSLSSNWQKGNIEVLSLRGRWDFSAQPMSGIVFKTQNAYLYQAFFSKKADNDLFSRNFVYWQPQRRVYPFLMLFLSKNYRRNIDFRYFTGAGLTWQAINKNNNTLKLALSGVYEKSRFLKNTFNLYDYNGLYDVETWRLTAWIAGKHQFRNDMLTLHYEAYIQPSLQHTDNVRWQADAGIEVKILKQFSFTVNYIYTHESLVTTVNKNNDMLLLFGLLHTFKK